MILAANNGLYIETTKEKAKGGVEMKVITSQSYVNESIVEEKKAMLEGAQSVELVVWTTGLQDLNGEDVCILSDGHHTYTAAMEMGIEVVFVEEEHPEGLMGEPLLEQAWMDSNYCYIGTNETVW